MENCMAMGEYALSRERTSSACINTGRRMAMVKWFIQWGIYLKGNGRIVNLWGQQQIINMNEHNESMSLR